MVHAVRGVDFDLLPGKTLGIVGESGSGKSVTSLAIMGLLPPTAEITGSVRLKGKELLGLSDKAMCEYRGNDIAMVFQDPLSSLTPVYTVGTQIIEALTVHHPDDEQTGQGGPRRRTSCAWWASPARRTGSRRSRTNSPAACASAS